MIGSTVQPDGMIWLGPGESHAKTIWPSAHGQLWPSASDAIPTKAVTDAKGRAIAYGGDLLDLHGTCYAGSVAVFLTIYYTPTVQASTAPASSATAR